jgi:hypothetical protein
MLEIALILTEYDSRSVSVQDCDEGRKPPPLLDNLWAEAKKGDRLRILRGAEGNN